MTDTPDSRTIEKAPPLWTAVAGDSPLLLNVPHAGTWLPPAVKQALRPEAAEGLPDTDWFVDRLYQPLFHTGISVQLATHSRYVVDLNRPADDAARYAGAATAVVPVRSFSGERLYPDGGEPTAEIIEQRLAAYWHPYHQQLRRTLSEIRQRHGFAILLDAHSIRGVLPRLFEGRLPDLNLGTHDGRSADPGIIRAARALLAEAPFAHVVDQRFKGGYITRYYGQPERQCHVLQLEIAQECYMPTDPPRWNEAVAAPLMGWLRLFVEGLATWRPVP